jgi:hypothetical protein
MHVGLYKKLFFLSAKNKMPQLCVVKTIFKSILLN